MNEQIEHITKQVDEYFDDLSIEFSREAWLKKFAELIVRECMEIVENNNPCPPGTIKMYSLLQDEYFDKGWQVATETKANQIKQHFGVEE